MSDDGDQGWVETESDEIQHPDVLENKAPYSVSLAMNQAVIFLQSYGWVFVAAVLLCFYLKMKYQQRVVQWMQKRSEDATPIDSEAVFARQEAMERVRKRMQEEHSAKAERFAEQQKIKEEEKRREKLADWERHQSGQGYKNRTRVEEPQDTSAPSTQSLGSRNRRNVYRNTDYNPLMGDGGGSSYRPARRGPTGGG